ncbi:hypothetical protein PHJA_000419300 [Phtheirospermum japonicum]|uniref:Uncharacterized protein n=1 Tax=Phtheirospermum japonicum TaxID=374723 RepID=A0A830B9W9_9LAMI|nr:hypothetical protein PHJA_000419300 [Phtheirospermum japonicum]
MLPPNTIGCALNMSVCPILVYALADKHGALLLERHGSIQWSFSSKRISMAHCCWRDMAQFSGLLAARKLQEEALFVVLIFFSVPLKTIKKVGVGSTNLFRDGIGIGKREEAIGENKPSDGEEAQRRIETAEGSIVAAGDKKKKKKRTKQVHPDIGFQARPWDLQQMRSSFAVKQFRSSAWLGGP